MLDCLDLDHADVQSYQQMLEVLDSGPDGTSVLGHPDHIRQRPTYQMPATDHPAWAILLGNSGFESDTNSRLLFIRCAMFSV